MGLEGPPAPYTTRAPPFSPPIGLPQLMLDFFVEARFSYQPPRSLLALLEPLPARRYMMGIPRWCGIEGSA